MASRASRARKYLKGPALQIQATRERALVATADAMLRPLAWLRRAAPVRPVRRVLLLRLERIGDLLMTREAIGLARAVWPAAQIDLAVGSWNASLAALIPGITTVHTIDVPWLAREGKGHGWAEMRRRARAWKSPGYDVVINFEPDIRSNALAWLSGAPHRVGYWTGGGGPFLTTRDRVRSGDARRCQCRTSGPYRRGGDRHSSK
jgi:hypothetical protein